MTVSSSRGRPAARTTAQGPVFAALALAFVAALALAPAAAAQDASVGEPLQLGPADEEAANGSGEAAPSDGSAGAGQPASSGDDEPLPGEGAEGIEVDRLEAMDPETIGPLDADNGGLGTDMWAGTPRRVVVELLPRLAGDLATPELRALAQRLLLSSATPPERRQAGGADADLLAMRIERLMALGAVPSLNELMRVLPRQLETPGIARRRVEGLLLAHQRQRACRIARNAVAESDAVFWQKALATCQLAQEQLAEANLTVSLLREQGATDDSAFFQLFDAVERGAERLPENQRGQLAGLRALHLTLVEIGGLDLAEASLAEAPTRVLVALARSQSPSLEIRAEAAERAAALGALPADRLGELYRAFSFADERLTRAASLEGARSAADMDPTRRRAMLYQALRGEDAAAVQAELMRQLFADGDGTLAPGLFLAMAELLAPQLSGLAAQPDLVWFAETAGRALYAAGRPAAAGAWLRVAQQEAIINPSAAAAVTALWPYARLSGAPEVPANGGLGVWRQAQDASRQAALGAQQSLLRAAMDALGEPPEHSWIEIALDDPGARRPGPPTALFYALEEAGRAGRRGETVLLALLVLGGTPPGQCHPAALGQVLQALDRVGLTDSARRLAVEIAIHNGI